MNGDAISIAETATREFLLKIPLCLNGHLVHTDDIKGLKIKIYLKANVSLDTAKVADSYIKFTKADFVFNFVKTPTSTISSLSKY